MVKKYVFVNNIRDKIPIYEMSETEFQRIPAANENVFEVFRFEELFAMLIDNFFAFNNVVLIYADKARLQSMVPSNYFPKRLDINRAALNFFATLSLYQDFICERIVTEEIKGLLSRNREIMRCMVMRNYIQHVESFPIIANSSQTKGDLNITLSSVRFKVEAKKLKIERLRKRTKKDFATFFDMDEQIDLYEIVNRGMGEVQLVQRKIRELPLYEEYSQSKTFLLGIENKIAPNGISMIKPCYYFESDDEQDLRTCFMATDTIKFIDENITNHSCKSSCADQFITTAPPDFVDKCSKTMFIPAIRQKRLELIREGEKK